MRTELPPALTEKDKDRFWQKVNKAGPDECWLWTAGKIPDGYGRIAIGWPQRFFLAHRLSYFLATGVDPDLCVCHRCDTPACVNPAHLFLGTHTDNMRDRNAKGRAGHRKGDAHHARLNPELVARGESQHLAKLTEERVREIRTLFAGGATKEQLGVRFGVTRQSIGAVVARQTWKHVL